MTDDELIETHLAGYATDRENHGPEKALDRLRVLLEDDDLADAVVRTWHERTGDPRPVRAVVADDLTPHTFAPGQRWEHVVRQLADDPKFPDTAVSTIRRESHDIARLLDDPSRDRGIRTRGLVVGRVQSGKTTNFLAVAAAAADRGYDLIIVLAGIHNSLRRQTERRLGGALVHREALWWRGTRLGDFAGEQNPLTSVLYGDGKRGLLVVKKQVDRLGRVADWLEESVHALDRYAILVIDDEADQAGLDVAPTKEIAGVHEQVMRIVGMADRDDRPRVAYVGYTATPYANILTSNPDDGTGLYPRSFIYPLDRPDGHIGGEQLFGDDTVGRPIHVGTGRALDGDRLDPELRQAIDWFVLATAARASLHERGLDGFHSTMLIHLTSTTDEHFALQGPVSDHLRALQARLLDEGAMEELREQYGAELRRVDAAACDETAADFDDLKPWLAEVVRRLLDEMPAGPTYKEEGTTYRAACGVIVDNGYVGSEHRLTYSEIDDDTPGIVAVAIGGNTLSRGLTLEGLVCSYFGRSSANYDTMQQMGRWYGFRPGYRHLTRLWTTPLLRDTFQSLNDVDNELRQRLSWMMDVGLTPERFGPRIRKLPMLNITRRAVMKNAQTEHSYADVLRGTTFVHRTKGELDHNLEKTRAFLRHTPQEVRPTSHRPGWWTHSVPLDSILNYLRSLKFPLGNELVRPDVIEEYAKRVGAQEWNVAIATQARGPSQENLGIGESVETLVRSPLPSDVEHPDVASLGAIVDGGHARLDLADPRPHTAQYRDEGEPPVLVIYPIDAMSAHASGERKLDAPTTVIGYAVCFPAVPDQGVDTYVTPMVTGDQIDPDELAELEARLVAIREESGVVLGGGDPA